MTIVAVDIGNSATKIAIANAAGDSWGAQVVMPDEQPADLPPLDDRADWFLCSVHRQRLSALQAWIRQHRPADQINVLTWRDIGLQIDLPAPDQVGLDRLVGTRAAMEMVGPEGAAIVVDAGTAVTIDLVTGGVFRGGVILPGAQMGFQSLGSHTDALPQLRPDAGWKPASVLGRSTADAICAGVYFGQIETIRGIVRRLQQDCDRAARVIATGRGIQWLRADLPAEWQYLGDLVLSGVMLVARARQGGNS